MPKNQDSMKPQTEYLQKISNSLLSMGYFYLTVHNIDLPENAKITNIDRDYRESHKTYKWFNMIYGTSEPLAKNIEHKFAKIWKNVRLNKNITERLSGFEVVNRWYDY